LALSIVDVVIIWEFWRGRHQMGCAVPSDEQVNVQK